MCPAQHRGAGPAQPFPASFAGLYDAYFGQFAAAVGQGLFEQIYRPILGLLGAVRDPVSLPVIAGALNIPPEKVLFALFDSGDLLLSRRYPDDPWTYVEPAHEAFREFVGGRPELLRPAHAALAEFYLQSFRGQWGLAAATRQGLYGLSHLPAHLHGAGRRADLYALARDPEFLDVQRTVLTEQPNAAQSTIRLALQAAVEADEPCEMAEFCLRHSFGQAELRRESPLQTLRGGQLERAILLCEQMQPREHFLMLLLLWWELLEQKRSAWPVRLEQKLLGRDWPRLAAPYWCEAARCLSQIALHSVLPLKLLERVGDDKIKPDLALHLAKIGQTEQALAVARSIQIAHWQVDALRGVAAALAQAGQSEQAGRGPLDPGR